MIRGESTNFNRKLYLNISMLLILFLVSLFRGDGKNPSVIGVKKCTSPDSGILATLIIAAVIEFAIGVWWISQELKTKKRVGFKLEKGDVEMKPANITLLTFLGLIGGFISGGFGVGPAFVFNPLLFQLGVIPPVASDTGMYVTTVGTLSSTIVVLCFKKLNLAYCGVILLAIIPGTLIGLHWQYKLVAMFKGKTSITVFFLLFQIFFMFVANAGISIVVLVRKAQAGINTMVSQSYC